MAYAKADPEAEAKAEAEAEAEASALFSNYYGAYHPSVYQYATGYHQQYQQYLQYYQARQAGYYNPYNPYLQNPRKRSPHCGKIVVVFSAADL